MISRSTDVRAALRSRQRGFLLNPYRFAAGGGGTDPNFANVNLLLHMTGTNGSTSFPDSSSFARTMTANNGAQITTAQSRFGDGSGLFNNSAFLISSSAMSFGTGNFTVEGHFRFNSTGDMGVLAGLNTGEMDLAFIGTQVRIGRLNTAWDSSFNFTRSTGVWYHVAWCRSGTDLRAFVDGTQVGSTATNSTSYNAATTFKVGTSTTTDRRFNGWINDLRVTIGVARYTANFTPPSAPFPNS